MRCPDCPRYDEESSTCRDKKVNPRTWRQAVEVAQLFGPRVICVFNDHRERILDVYQPPQNDAEND